MMTAGPVSLYRFPQDVSLRTEFDSFVAGGRHGLYVSSSLSFGPKIISKAIFNNQGKDEYGMRNGRLYGSGYLMLEIRLCLIGERHYGRDSITHGDVGACCNRDHGNKR
ncbi:MAG: hypothetical protein NT178_00080 [Proteobacteria bacterium]|nr:hypothetical protein [Pseudomonadota bacterium]